MIIAAFCFSLMSLFVKLAGQRLPAAEIVFARSVFGVVITYTLVRRAGIPVWGKRKSLLLLRGGIGFCGLVTYFYAVTKLPLGDVTAIFFTAPAFTALFAAILLKEGISRHELLGILVSLTGVALVARPSFIFGAGADSLDPLAVAAVLTSAVFSGLAFTIVRKLSETDHHLTVIFYYPLIATPLSIPLMLPTAIWPEGSEWLALIGVGIVTQIAHLFMTRALHAERAGRAMSASYVQIVFAAIWGVVFFGETPSVLGVIGTACVIAGTLLVIARRPKQVVPPRRWV